MNTARIILAFLVFFLIIYLILQNSTEVAEVKIFFDIFKVPLAYIMFYSYLFGLLTVGIFALFGEIRLRSEIRRLKKDNAALLEELSLLRNLALTEKEE